MTGFGASLTVQRCTDDAWKALGSAVDLIKNVETKAAATLALATTVGGLLFNLVKGQRLESIALMLPAGVSAISAAAAAIAAAMTLWPRLYTKDCVKSELFFGHMDRKFHTPDDFMNQARTLLSDQDRLTRELIGQYWSISCIARTKYMWSKVALALALTALAGLTITAIVVTC
jgi:hypothetical protein